MLNNLTIRNARIIFRNFSGRASQYTPEGRRSFSVVIEDEALARDLIQDGWNLKLLKKRDDNEPNHWHLPVAVFFDKYPPQIVNVSGNNKIALGEDTVSMLDWAEIKYVNLTIRPHEYEIGARKGVKAYLKTMIAFVVEDELLNDLGGDAFNNDDIPF